MIALEIEELVDGVFVLGGWPGVKEWMPEKFDLPASRCKCRSQHGFAFEDVRSVLINRYVVGVEVGIRVVAQIGAGIQPEVENLAEVLGRQAFVPFVDEADDRNILLTERSQEFFGHCADGSNVARAAVAAAREVINGDRDLPARAGQRDSAE